jgi:hypothetical protein
VAQLGQQRKIEQVSCGFLRVTPTREEEKNVKYQLGRVPEERKQLASDRMS